MDETLDFFCQAIKNSLICGSKEADARVQTCVVFFWMLLRACSVRPVCWLASAAARAHPSAGGRIDPRVRRASAPARRVRAAPSVLADPVWRERLRGCGAQARGRKVRERLRPT